MEPDCEPYETQDDLVRDQLHVIRRHLRAASEPARALDPLSQTPSDTPEDLAIAVRLHATPHAATFPLVQLFRRLELTCTEQRVLWMLIAHEFCPLSRQMIRTLATEQVLDPTTDAIRRTVYASGLDAAAWYELGAAGSLRKHVLIERTDEDPRTPSHRQTWRLSARVAALVHDVLDLDPALAAVTRLASGPVADLELPDGIVGDLAGCAVLLFDEADALFAKRTEVRTSNDRHANQEIDYLLQRLEAFRGTCILTTNHETAIDEAFRRRLSAHVRFQLPDTDERHRLWQAMIPEAAPSSGDLRLDDLARRFPMSGGYIRNAVLRAAFLAADEDSVLDARRLSRAAQLEYEALGKIVARH